LFVCLVVHRIAAAPSATAGAASSRPPVRYYDGSLLDNFISDDSFVAEGIENQVSFALMLAQSDVMLSVQIWPLEVSRSDERRRREEDAARTDRQIGSTSA